MSVFKIDGKLIFSFLFITLLNGQVVINEFMSSNNSVIFDEFGNTPDWIEIYNENNINLSGYGLFR